jgi:hypothetical protein
LGEIDADTQQANGSDITGHIDKEEPNEEFSGTYTALDREEELHDQDG